MTYLDIFFARIFKNIFSYFKSAPSNLWISKILRKNKAVLIWNQKDLIWVFLDLNLKLLSHLIYVQYFAKEQKYLNLGQNVPYLGSFGLGILKTFVILEISTLKFLYLQNLVINEKCLNSGPKFSHLGIFRSKFQKNNCHAWNQICILQNLAKNKNA